MSKPSHVLYQIEKSRTEGKPAFWREVGVAWANQDGSFNTKFHVVPLIGVHDIQMRPLEDKTQQQDAPAETPARGRGRNK